MAFYVDRDKLFHFSFNFKYYILLTLYDENFHKKKVHKNPRPFYNEGHRLFPILFNGKYDPAFYMFLLFIRTLLSVKNKEKVN